MVYAKLGVPAYAETGYGYDELDQPTSMTDALAAVGTRTFEFSYDTLGRKIGTVDPDLGTWADEYDPVGTLKAQTDAKGQSGSNSGTIS